MSDDLHLNPFHTRLVELETAFAFQQQLVEELNTGLVEQSRAQRHLEQQVRALREQLETRQASATSRPKPSDDDRPGEASPDEEMSET